LRKFGENEFDDHEFSGDFSLPDRDGDEDELPSRSPSPDAMPPGFQQPFKFRRESSGNFDTFQHKRHHSRGLSITKRDSKKRNSQRPVLHEEDAKDTITEGKRPPPSPNKNSTPKRRRTLMAWEFSPETSVVITKAETAAETHLKMQAAIKSKRKDSRPGSAITRADPDVLARRQILRPRNPTPRQRRRLGSSELDNGEEEEEEDDGQEYQNEDTQENEERVNQLPDVPELSDAMQESIIASELESFTHRIGAHHDDEMGRKSVTTQDYLDEAVKVMNFLRAQGRPGADVGYPMESRLEDIQEDTLESQENFDADSDSFSRPPSREDGKGGWRPRVIQRRASVEERLRKFQEPEDDTYLRSSSFADNTHPDNHPAQIETVESEPSGISIIPATTTQDHKGAAPDSQNSVGSDHSHRTHASGGSSLAHTTTSKRSETVNTIAPEAVSAMIPESVAGLHFDKTKNAWVKSSKHLETTQLSTATPVSDDDPFNSIPDLTFDAEEEAHRLQEAQTQFGGRMLPIPGLRPSGQSNQTTLNHPHHDDEHKDHSLGEKTALESARTSPEGYKRPASHFFASSSLFPSPLAPQTAQVDSAVHDVNCLQEMPLSTAVVPSGALDTALGKHLSFKSPPGDDCEAEEAKEVEDSQLAVSPSISLSPVSRPAVSSREESPSTQAPPLNTSSLPDNIPPPPTSHLEAPFSRPVGCLEGVETIHKQSTPATESPQLINQGARVNEPTRSFNSSFDVRSGSQLQPTEPVVAFLPASEPEIKLSSQFCLSPAQNAHNSVAIATQFPPPSTISPQQTPEKKFQTLDHNPLSLVPTTALIPTISHPFNSLALQSSPGVHYSTFLLSELGDLTIHQDDEVNQSYRQIISKHSGRVTFENRFESGDQLLVKALTDCYGATVDWTTLTAVDISNKSLTSLRLLKELCPNIMDLDVSNNQLYNLEGLPDAELRQLRLLNNKLGPSTTAFSYRYNNLDVIDVSGNRLETMTIFRGLTGNIRLVINRNSMQSLGGLEDSLTRPVALTMRDNLLSGPHSIASPNYTNLTHLDLSRNQMTKLHAIGQLKCLMTLDLSHNKLREIEPLDQLKQLQEINLSNNKLTAFEGVVPAKVQKLDLSRNLLESFAPVFHCHEILEVQLQENKLTGESIDMSQQDYQRIGKLNLRSQAASLGTLSFLAGGAIKVTELLLGNNRFDPALFEQHAFLPDDSEYGNINFLELASCGLDALPPNLHLLFPGLKMLNVNFNNLKSVHELCGCNALEILLIAGNKLKGLRDTAIGISAIQGLKVLDTRGNPFSQGHHDSALLFRVLQDVPDDGVKTAHVYNQHQVLKRSPQAINTPVLMSDTISGRWASHPYFQYHGDPFNLAWSHHSYYDNQYQRLLSNASADDLMKRRFWELIMVVRFGNRLQLLDGLTRKKRKQEALLTMEEAVLLDRIIRLGIISREAVRHMEYPQSSRAVQPGSVVLPEIEEGCDNDGKGKKDGQVAE
jgi:hypothetical protein